MTPTKNERFVQPYLIFEGRCEEAIQFYQRALGAEVPAMFRFKDSPEPPAPGCMPAGCENKIMHAQVRLGQSHFMVSDGRCSGTPSFQGFSLSLAVGTEAEVDRAFNALADGGKVQAPLSKTFFSPRFGMVTDRFGVTWMILVHPEGPK